MIDTSKRYLVDQLTRISRLGQESDHVHLRRFFSRWERLRCIEDDGCSAVKNIPCSCTVHGHLSFVHGVSSYGDGQPPFACMEAARA